MENRYVINDDIDQRVLLRKVLNECFDGKYQPEKRYIICIQGVTSSGKSVFAKTLSDSLTLAGVSNHLFQLDAFYNVPDNPTGEIDEYDFDNPVAFHWENIYTSFSALRDEEDSVPYFERAKKHGDPILMKRVPNIKPRVIIIEGIYAFNILNEKIFNIKEYDPYNSNKVMESEYIDNVFNVGDFKILKIMFTHCSSKLFAIRRARDLSVGKTEEAIKKRFYDKILPDTLRWVYSPNNTKFIKVVHGNFNKKKILILGEELMYFFTQTGKLRFNEILTDLSNEFQIKCSGECNQKDNSLIVLANEE